MPLVIGDPAPDFTLPGLSPDGERRDYHLADFRGEPVVLVFYPGDDTPVCTRQLKDYTQGFARFSEVGARVLALSPQDLESHERFATKYGGFAFPLLADVDKSVAERYNVPGPLGFYRRSVFVVDAGGRIGYVHRAFAGLGYRPIEELVEAIREVGQPH